MSKNLAVGATVRNQWIFDSDHGVFSISQVKERRLREFTVPVHLNANPSKG